MESDWVKIYTSGDFFRSEMVRQVLIDQGIDAVVLNKQDQSYRFGEVEVYIHQADFDHAIEVIIKHEL